MKNKELTRKSENGLDFKTLIINNSLINQKFNFQFNWNIFQKML